MYACVVFFLSIIVLRYSIYSYRYNFIILIFPDYVSYLLCIIICCLKIDKILITFHDTYDDFHFVIHSSCSSLSFI